MCQIVTQARKLSQFSLKIRLHCKQELLYKDFLEKPGSEIAHKLLHTHYQARKKQFDFEK